MPADERLQAVDPTAPQVDERLEVQQELVALERSAEVGTERELGGRRRLRTRRIETMGIASLRFRAVHRAVGVAKQLAGVRAVARIRAYADACGDEELPTCCRERISEVLQQIVGDERQRRPLRDFDDGDELVTAEPGQRVVIAKGLTEPLRHLLQHVVAHLVTERVVDLLEIIDVDEHQARELSVAPSPF